MYTLLFGKLTAEEFCALTSAVGWGAPPIEQVRVALQNSLYTITAVENGRPVGMGRICGDKSLSFYIKDLVVVPELQGRGIGKMIVSAMLDHIKTAIQPGWKVSVELIATKEAEVFYGGLGFGSLPNGENGAGMLLMVEN